MTSKDGWFTFFKDLKLVGGGGGGGIWVFGRIQRTRNFSYMQLHIRNQLKPCCVCDYIVYSAFHIGDEFALFLPCFTVKDTCSYNSYGAFKEKKLTTCHSQPFVVPRFMVIKYS